MTAAEEKIRVVEKVLGTDDTLLLREVSSLLHTPTLSDYTSHEAFLSKIDRVETAYQNGELTDHGDVKKRIAA